MNKELKQFIEENISLIEQDKWEEIYRKARNIFHMEISELAEIMLEADIHPERYLKELPDRFLFGSSCKKFIIPNHITKIGVFAFCDYKNLTSITIPKSVTEIGDYAFSSCSSLMNVKIASGVIRIGSSAFQRCISLKSIDIPNSVTELGEDVFMECTSLTNVTIPTSVTIIGNDAFIHCGDNLTITYAGTKADWKKIYNSKAFRSTYFTVNCTDGTLVKKKR